MRSTRVLGIVLAVSGMVGITVAEVGAAASVAAPLSSRVAEPTPWEFIGVQPKAWRGTAFSPGSERSTDLALVNLGSSTMTVSLRAVDVVDEENNCLRQELKSVLEDCSTEAGELSEQLLVTLTAGGPRPVYAGTLADLAGTDTAPIVVSPDERVVVRLDMTLPESSTNETMTDSVSFGIRAEAGASAGGSKDVSISAPGPRAAVLPATGAPVQLAQLLGSGALVLLGVALARWGRRGRVSPGRRAPGEPA